MVRGANQVVGQVGLVRSIRGFPVSFASSTVHPSAICSTGPSPATMFRRDMVTGMPPRVSNSVEKPPPRK